jgi:hypothetical protein
MNTIISTRKLIDGLYKLSQYDLVSLWNEYQNDTYQDVKIYCMKDFDDVVPYEEVSPSELMWMVRDRELDPDDKYFYVQRKYMTKVISFDDVFMEGSPIDFNELSEHLIEHINDMDNQEVLNLIEEIKEDDNNHNNNHLEEDDDEDDIPLF